MSYCQLARAVEALDDIRQILDDNNLPDEHARATAVRARLITAPIGAGTRETLEEIVRALDAHERGEPFGDDEVGSLPLLPYIHDLARGALPSRDQGDTK